MDEKQAAALRAQCEQFMLGKMTIEQMNTFTDALTDEEFEFVGSVCKTQSTALNTLRESGYRRNAKKRGEVSTPFADGDDPAGLEFTGYSLKGVQVFATGTHTPKSGEKFKATDAFLKKMIECNTGEYLDRQRPAVTIGHDERLGDSEPRVGRLAKVWKKGGAIFADFANVTKNTYQAIKNGLYDSNSLTIAKGDKPYILSVALLGAKAPAVKGMKTLQDALALGEADAAEAGAVFTFVSEFRAGDVAAADGDTDPGQEGDDMPPDEKQFVTAEQFAALTKQVETLGGDLKLARGEAETFRDLYKAERIERFAERLVNARKLRPADVGVFKDHARGKNALDVVEFSEGGKPAKGSSLDAMFSDYMARGELWRAGETADGIASDPTLRAKPDETPEAKAEIEAGVKFAEGAGIDPEIVRKNAGPPLKKSTAEDDD